MPAKTSGLTALLPLALLVSTPLAAANPAAPDTSSVAGSEALSASAPWWERLVMTVGEKGETRACRYQSSLAPGKSRACDVEGGAKAGAARDLPEQFTQLTFERRFSPAASMADGEVSAGETLLGKAVLALAIGADGKVQGCKLVAAGGMRPDYGCKEATAEKFEASASTNSAVAARVATLTILVYAHAENHV